MSMNRILSFMPFGAQYYRAPTPLPEEWDADLRRMRDAGFNTIKVWAQWRWNNPAEGRFDFSDLTLLLDTAQAHGLRVVVNLIMDCAPAWLFAAYPDCRMVTAGGRTLGPVTTPYRQIGGVPGHCLHHKAAVKHSVRFVEEAAKALGTHPSLAFWDLWNEPELTVGLLREPKIGDLVCACPSSRAAFLDWLECRYSSLERLNRVWSRNYQTWDEVELPVQPQTYRDFIDWRLFFAETMRDELLRRKEAVRRWDTVHPVVCHTVPPPIFPLVSCGSDDWLLAEPGDLHGNSVGSDPFAADLLRSAARGKAVINAEIHALPGGAFSRPRPIGSAEMKRHILIPLAHGIKGFLFWQYRPERLGGESPAWGLTNPDGSPAPWLEPASHIARALLADEEFFLAASPLPAKAALLADPENQIFCWAGTLAGDLYSRSLDGAYRALARAGYQVDFVHPSDFAAGLHQQYRCLYLPVPYWLAEPVAGALGDYVRRGGSVVSEIWPAAYDSARSLHSTVTPGMGLDQLFGCRERMTWPLTTGFDAYAMMQAAEGRGRGLAIRLSRHVGGLAAGTAIPVCVAVSEYEGEAEVLGVLPNGGAAITRMRSGEGGALLAGAPLAYSASQPDGGACGDLIAELVRESIGDPDVLVEGPGRADILQADTRRFLVVSNESEERAVIRLKASGQVSGFLGDEPEPRAGGGWLEFALPGRAVEGYWLA
jgi:beta-galactosidase